MKKYCITLLIGAVTSMLYATNQCSTSRTFMFTRPLYHNLPALEQYWHLLHKTIHGEQAPIINAVGLFQHSLHDAIADYFLLNCQSKILVAGDASLNAQHRNVRAEWLGLSNNFEGTLSLMPQQSQAGAVISYDTGFGICSSWKFLRNLRWGIRIPIVTVTNALYPCAQSANSKADALIAAFEQPTWRFAKISTQELKKTGVAEVIGRFSTVWLDDDDFFLASALAIGIPATKRQFPSFLFNPFVGPNGHINFINTVLLELPLHHKDAESQWLIRFIFEDRFYYPNHQLRTLDLQNKPWSRYLTLRREGETETVPAMNVLTQCVKVSPQSVIELQAGLLYKCGCFMLEAGYGLWGRHHETLALTRPLCEKSIPIFTEFGISGTGTSSASGSTISFQAPNDPTFVRLKESDLDLCGSGSSGAVVNRFYILVNYIFRGRSQDWLVSTGGFFESPQRNNALKQWGMWGNVNIAF